MVLWQDRDQKYKVQTLKTELCSSGQSKLLLPKVSTSLHDSIITCVVFNSARYDRNTTRISVKEKGKFCLLILREKCPYSEFFWSVFSLIRIEYGEILRFSGPYSVRMRENTDQKNS